MVDFGTGNNNKMNWPSENKQEVGSDNGSKGLRVRSRAGSMLTRVQPDSQMIDIIETVYRGASKGRGLVVSPKGELYGSLVVCSRQALRKLTRSFVRLLYPVQVLKGQALVREMFCFQVNVQE
jgi:hypothetical protein